MDPKDDPLWLALPPTDPLSDTPGEHKIEFVSRHAIAETGLTCPVCQTEVAPIGDYRLVRHSRLGDVIQCNGKRDMKDVGEVPCGMFLVASPDTEHGDHILYDNIPREERAALFHSFVRITEGEAARRKYGEDIIKTHGELAAVAQAAKPVHVHPKLPLKAKQVWQTNDGRIMQIVRMQGEDIPAVPHTGLKGFIARIAARFGIVMVKKPAVIMHKDAFYAGWAYGEFQTMPGTEWHVDPTGLIRQSMRDPTLSDTVRLTSEIRPN